VTALNVFDDLKHTLRPNEEQHAFLYFCALKSAKRVGAAGLQ
jgi:hypothetical protein